MDHLNLSSQQDPSLESIFAAQPTTIWRKLPSVTVSLCPPSSHACLDQTQRSTLLTVFTSSRVRLFSSPLSTSRRRLLLRLPRRQLILSVSIALPTSSSLLYYSLGFQMENSFAQELYSESLHLSKVELGSSQAANCDLQDDDGSFWGGSDEELDKSSDLDREWERRRDQFHTIGYRDGLIAGKEAIAQDGFNIGFKESVLEGYNWGIVRGITSALACLPEQFKERLIETRETINKFQTLYETVHSLSTTDALKMFHDDKMAKKTVEQSEHPNATSEMESFQNDGADCSLDSYVVKLQSLVLESPAIESHLLGK